MTEKEKDCRSRLAQMIHGKEIVVGSLQIKRRVCGKAECKCVQGAKHASLYLSTRYKGKRKDIFIPKTSEAQAREANERYQAMKRMMDVISSACIERLLVRPARTPKGSE
jgi:hypothetical protein